MFEIKLKGLVNYINGNDKAVMTTQITVRDLLEIYVIDNEVNRDINYARLRHISRYVDSYDSPVGVFLPSLVFSISDEGANYYDVVNKELRIPTKGVKLKVIDGQHRIKGLEYFLNVCTDFDRKEEILNSNLTAQIYFGLNEKNQKDVFVDINSNSKRVSMSLVTKYDTRDIMRVLVRDLYASSDALQNAGVEFDKSKIVRPTNELLFTSSRLRNFITMLLFGTMNVSKKNEKITKDKYDDILMFLDKYFTILLNVLPPVPGDVRKYALGHEALQNAIALFSHKAVILEIDPDLSWISDWESEVEMLGNFDWSAHNPLFRGHMIVSKPNTDYEFKRFIDNKHDKLAIILEEELL